MNAHKQRLHEPRTKSSSTVDVMKNATVLSVEERMDTEDSVSYMIQSHEMMNMPSSLSFNRSRSRTAIHNNVYISKSSSSLLIVRQGCG